MRAFFTKFSSSLSTLLILSFVFVTTISFQLISPKFLVNTLEKANAYEKTQLALRYSLQNQIEKEIADQGVDIEKLTVGERQLLEQQAVEITKIATIERLQEFSETNIQQVADFLNGKSEKLFLYVPLEEWGIYENIDDPNTESLFSEQTDVESLLDENPNSLITKSHLQLLHNIANKIKSVWYLTAFLIFALLIINFVLSSKEFRLQSTANIFLTSGGIVIVVSMLLKYMGENLVRSSPYIRDPSKIIFGALVPTFVNEVTKLWVAMGLGLFLTGLMFHLIITIISRRKNTQMAKKQPKTQFEPT
jgi:hypothetical protein